MIKNREWQTLEKINLETIQQAREYAHEAVQFIAGAGISFIPAQADDSHTNCLWNDELQALVGHPFGDEKFHLGLNLSDLKLKLWKDEWRLVDEISLNGKKIDDISEWFKNILKKNGFESSQFTLKKHYEIPAYATAKGEPFLMINENAFIELSKYFSNADMILHAFIQNRTDASPVNCWPHHFDIATLLNINSEKIQSIGIGMSPGDDNYDEPYFYISPWPYPDLNTIVLPDLSTGIWHTKNWIGAILTASELLRTTSGRTQLLTANEFINTVVSLFEGMK